MEQYRSQYPLVSVVIPVIGIDSMNLSRCLSSIVNQSYPNYEVIVIHSSNENVAGIVCQKYGARYFHAYALKSAARNIGATLSKGELIIHLDADMALTRDVLSECVQSFRNGAEAIIIPEQLKGRGFFMECRQLEKKSCEGNEIMEAARCVARNLHDRIGGFDDRTGNIDEYSLQGRIERTGARIDSISQSVIVEESIFDLRKKFRQGRCYRFYSHLYPYKARKQFSPKERVRSYWKVGKDKPGHFLPMLLLKTIDCLVFILGATMASTNPGVEEPRESLLDLRRGFDKIGSSYERELLATHAGKLLNEVETRALQALVARSLENPKPRREQRLALDLGCGPGRLSGLLLETDFKTVGIDVSMQMCKASKIRFHQEDFEAICADAEHLPLKEGCADLVVSFRMIKYSNFPEQIICETKRVIAGGGHIILEVPNLLSPFYFVAKTYSKLFRPSHAGVMNYLNRSHLFSLKACRTLLSEYGFREQKVEGLSFLPQGLLTHFGGGLSQYLLTGNALMAANPHFKVLSRSFLFLAQVPDATVTRMTKSFT